MTRPQSSSFLPDFCSVRSIFAVVVVSELLAIILVFGSGVPLSGFWARLSMLSLYVQWISLGSTAVLCALGRVLSRMNTLAATLSVIGVVVAVSVAVSATARYLISRLLGAEILPPDGELGMVLRTVIIAAIGIALLLRYFHLQYQWRIEVEAEARARLESLQARIRPHFLFNSMNTVASLTRTEPQKAEQIVEDLADLFRASLSDTTRSSTLAKELELARQYISIERYRLGDRLHISWDLADDLPVDAAMPGLVLQPLLENAVYHGIESAPGGGRIDVCGRMTRGLVNLSIRNTIPAESNGNVHRSGNHMALENTRLRLEGFFGGEGRLMTARVESEYRVRVAFPYPWKPEQ